MSYTVAIVWFILASVAFVISTVYYIKKYAKKWREREAGIKDNTEGR